MGAVTGRALPRILRETAARCQEEAVLPHCARCARPCCLLETLVLELTWERLRALWGVEGPRPAFDRGLRAGRGPGEIRERDGLYYAHGRPCPAYRVGRCAVYGTAAKPPGCTDFPIYVDDDGIMIDQRCEAMDLSKVEARLQRALPPGFRVSRRPDPDFPFLVTLAPVRGSPRGARTRRTRGRGR